MSEICTYIKLNSIGRFSVCILKELEWRLGLNLCGINLEEQYFFQGLKEE